MITAKAIWTDNERYIGEATSRHAIVMDTATEKTASTPMELVLIALCGCTASDVVGILRKKREPFTSLEVSARGRACIGLSCRVHGNQAGLSHRLVKCLAKRWKMPSASRKKNIARFRPCWKRRAKITSRRSNVAGS